MLRGEEWPSCAVPLVWVEFTADVIEHPVREVTSGMRFAVTLFTPAHLELLSENDWMNLESFGFPVHLYSDKDTTKEGGLGVHAATSLGKVSGLQEVPGARDLSYVCA